MESNRALIGKPPSAQTILQDELKQTFSECIGQSIDDAANNLQFSRHLYSLPVAYDQELECIEATLRSLVNRLDALVIAFAQSGGDATSGSHPSRSDDHSNIMGFSKPRSIDQAA